MTYSASKYPESATTITHVGTWSISSNSYRAWAIRTSGRYSDLGQKARTGMYSPNAGFTWTDTPDPPKYVKETALRVVRARRRHLGMHV